MNLIEISAIKIPSNRQRRQFDPASLHELADSITQRCLYHPIVLRVVGDGYQLVSGERRLRAVTDIYALGGVFSHDGQEVLTGCIPYTTIGDLDELAAEEAELEENVCRVDLTFQELAAATARLFSLRRRQAVSAGSSPPTVADLSLEIRGSSKGLNQEITRRQLIIADHLENPAVKGAKNLDEAFKALRREEAAKRAKTLGEQVGRVFTADVHRALNEDALDWLTKCPAEQFDCILTDPPYGMNADEFGDAGGLAQGAHGYVDDEASFTRILSICQTELFRVAKPQAHLYWFCDLDQFHNIKLAFAAGGWWVFRTPLIWYNKGKLRAPWPEHGPQRKYECILYAVKGKRPVLKMAGDVLEFTSDPNLGHAAQKPVALFDELLRRSCRAGDSVLDPFMGTGTIFAAAHALKVKATGIELDTASYGIAVKRLEELKAQQELQI